MFLSFKNRLIFITLKSYEINTLVSIIAENLSAFQHLDILISDTFCQIVDRKHALNLLAYCWDLKGLKNIHVYVSPPPPIILQDLSGI